MPAERFDTPLQWIAEKGGQDIADSNDGHFRGVTTCAERITALTKKGLRQREAHEPISFFCFERITALTKKGLRRRYAD